LYSFLLARELDKYTKVSRKSEGWLASELQEWCPAGKTAEFLDSASKEFLNVTNICA